MASAETATAAGPARYEDLWQRLLDHIEDGVVVPIVGQELLTIDVAGQPVPFYEHLARRLAERFGIALPSPLPRAQLNWVASRFLETGADPQPERIYSELQRIVKDLGTLSPPEPLRKLASIRPFRIFVSTTLDSMLADAINTERFGGNPSTEIVSYSPNNPADLSPDSEQSQRTIVYQLLGRASSMQDYVVTEEDALEFVHNLLFHARPKRIFSHIQKRNLLILGCSFPTWIVRFFIRASRESRLLLARGKMDVVVDSGTREDLALVRFLQGYKTRTEVFDTGTAIEFVDELHRRWTERMPERPGPPPDTAPRVFVKEGAIFLSYASEDRALVQEICGTLEKAGMDVWFDRHDLEPGDDFARKIRMTIEGCSLFVPILSRSCLKRNRRFLQLEWDHATTEARKTPASRHFIVPVVIDDVPLDSPEFPDVFGALHAAKLREGRLTDETVRSLLNDYREFQKRRGGV